MSAFARSPLYVLLPVLTLGLLATGCGGNGSDTASTDVPYQVGEPLSDSTVALVVSSEYGTDTLTATNFQQQIQRATQGLPPSQTDQMQSMHRKLVRAVARQHALRGEANVQNLQVDSARVSKELSRIKSQYQSEEQFQKVLAQSNLTIDSVRSVLASQLQQDSLQSQMAENFEEPTESEVDQYSKENRRIRAQHILIRVAQDAPQSTIDSARQAAQALVDSARMETVSFAELARRHSDGPSASQGGDVGFFSRSDMVEPFAEAAYALSDSGDVASEPVRTQYGFHVIRLTDPGEPMDTSKARNQMRQERRMQAVENQVDELLKNVTVRANPSVVDAGLYDE